MFLSDLKAELTYWANRKVKSSNRLVRSGLIPCMISVSRLYWLLIQRTRDSDLISKVPKWFIFSLVIQTFCFSFTIIEKTKPARCSCKLVENLTEIHTPPLPQTSLESFPWKAFYISGDCRCLYKRIPYDLRQTCNHSHIQMWCMHNCSIAHHFTGNLPARPCLIRFPYNAIHQKTSHWGFGSTPVENLNAATHSKVLVGLDKHNVWKWGPQHMS